MITYLFVSGFLGAGKTTLLNLMLRQYSHLKLGVIVNDFGDLGVDASLLDQTHVSGQIKELKSGQIFCSCLSGSFINSVLAYRDICPDLVLVECSGLAKPSTLKDIVQVIDQKEPEKFSCLGMVSVVDALRHRVLEQSLMVIHEQLEASDLLLLSKTSLVPAADAQKLHQDLSRKYPDKPILSFSPAGLNVDLVEMLQNRSGAYQTVDQTQHQGWGEAGRPMSFVLPPPTGITRADLLGRLQPFQSRWYRLKGTIVTRDKEACLVDATDGELHITPTTRVPDVYGVVVITHDAQLEHDLRKNLGLQELPSHKPKGLRLF